MAKQNDRVRERLRGEILDPVEAAVFLGVSKSSVIRLLNKGELPGFKVGILWRIRKDALDKFTTAA